MAVQYAMEWRMLDLQAVSIWACWVSESRSQTAFVDDQLVSSGLLMPSRKVVVGDELVEALAFVYRR